MSKAKVKAEEEAPEETPEESPETPEVTPEPEEEAPEVVPTALNPDTWPEKTGTVTDPDVLRRHGLEPRGGDAPEIVVEFLPEPAPERPSPQHELFQCLKNQLPTKHQQFWSDAHLKGEAPLCPTCGARTVIRAEAIAHS